MKINVRETYAKHKQTIFIIAGALLLIFILWFIFRRIKADWDADRSAEREFILKERDAARARIVADSIENSRRIDSIYKLRMGIVERVETIVKWRTKYVTEFIDTASIARKFQYVDSVLGPK